MSDWTELFKKQAQSEIPILPEDDWETMSRMLDRHILRKRIRKAASFAGAAAAAVVTAAIILISPWQTEEGNIPTIEIAKSETDPPADNARPANNDIVMICAAPKPINLGSGADYSTTPDETIELIELSGQIADEQVTEERNPSVAGSKPDKDPEDRWTWIDEEKPTRKKAFIFSLSKSLTTTSMIGSEPSGVTIINNPNNNPGKGSLGDSDEDNPANNTGDHIQAVIPGNLVKPVELKHIQYEHLCPYTLGVTVGIPLSERLFLTSGLDYSYCLSKITFSDNTKADQRAHYLGIPMRLDWIIVRNDRLSFYAGAGAEAYKCLFAEIGSYQRIKDGNTYYSANFLAGLRYEPFRHIGLFLEPQYSYSINNKEPVIKSAITDSRYLFNVRAGVSFSF